MKTTAAAQPARQTPSSHGGGAGRSPHSFRVLLANEPRSYREAIGAVVRALGPAGTEVFWTEAEGLDCKVTKLAPDLVFCSRLSALVEAKVAAWVELHPGHGSKSRICMKGELKTIEGIELPELLSVVERAWKLAGAAKT